MHRGDQGLAVGQLQLLHRHAPLQHAGVVGRGEVLVLDVAEIGEGDLGDLVLDVGERQAQLRRPCPMTSLFLEVPLAALAPAEADRAARRDDVAARSRRRRRSSSRDCWLRRAPRRSRRRARSGRGRDCRRCLARAAPASACRCTGARSRGNTAPAGRRDIPSGSRGPSPWRAPSRCPASPTARCRRTSRLPNSPGRSPRSSCRGSAPRCRNAHRACASAARSSPTG